MWPGSARLAALVLPAMIGAPGCSDLMCGNTVKAEARSPDGAWTAVAFIRDCGATTGYSLQVSVLPAGLRLPNDPGNLYVQRYDQPVTLLWENLTTLRITHDADVRPVRMERAAGPVTVRYVPSVEGRQ